MNKNDLNNLNFYKIMCNLGNNVKNTHVIEKMQQAYKNAVLL